MEDMFELMLAEQQKQEIQKIISYNDNTRKYGLVLTEEDVKELVVSRKESLKEHQRVEFGDGILPDLIYAFCDSSYIHKENYAETLMQLQDIFYLYKNELQDELTDSELIEFMRRQFDDICFGDLEYLQGTCLERLARAVRAGYQTKRQHQERDEYSLRDGGNEYLKWDEETRWEDYLEWE